MGSKVVIYLLKVKNCLNNVHSFTLSAFVLQTSSFSRHWGNMKTDTPQFSSDIGMINIETRILRMKANNLGEVIGLC